MTVLDELPPLSAYEDEAPPGPHRAPPHDLDAEASLLGACLLGPQAIDDALDAGLEVSDLYGPSHRHIWVAVTELYAAGTTVEPVTLAAHLATVGHTEITAGHLVDLEAGASTAGAASYARIVIDRARMRRLIGVGSEIAQLGYDLPTDIDAAEDTAANLLAAVASRRTPGDPTHRFVTWSEFWATDHGAAEWLLDGVFARGRAHAIYAKHKQGKSLFTLWSAAKLATGPDPVVVLYLDFEMTPADLAERLEDMGHGAASDLTRLNYALLPSIPPLDTAAGARELASMLQGVRVRHPDHHPFVVIDTTGRAVQGEENAADTIQAYYRHTGLMLKQAGATSVRLDHAGKDATKGQRGSSAKGDDVDLVWKLSQAQGGIALKRELTRISWAPESIAFALGQDPLRYVRSGDLYKPGTEALATQLDDLAVPIDASSTVAIAALREAGAGRAKALVLDALRYRREVDRD